MIDVLPNCMGIMLIAWIPAFAGMTDAVKTSVMNYGKIINFAAKKAKNYAEADRIRKELLEAGIVLEDSAAGTTWRRA